MASTWVPSPQDVDYIKKDLVVVNYDSGATNRQRLYFRVTDVVTLDLWFTAADGTNKKFMYKAIAIWYPAFYENPSGGKPSIEGFVVSFRVGEKKDDETVKRILSSMHIFSAGEVTWHNPVTNLLDS